MKKKVQKAVKKSVSKSVTRRTPIRVGNKIFARTVTNYYTGKIVYVSSEEIVLDQAAWISDTGRFSDAMATGVFNEVEPYPDGVLVSLSRGAGNDVSDWPHELPRSQK